MYPAFVPDLVLNPLLHIFARSTSLHGCVPVSRSANGLHGMAEWTQGAQISASPSPSSLDQSEVQQQRLAWAESRAWAVASQVELLGCMAQLLEDEFEEGTIALREMSIILLLFLLLLLSFQPFPFLLIILWVLVRKSPSPPKHSLCPFLFWSIYRRHSHVCALSRPWAHRGL